MHKESFLIAIAVAALTIMFWASMNRPTNEPAWPKVIQGFSFAPFRADQDPTEERYPSLEQIDADLALLAGRTHAVRTYSVQESLGEIPDLAKKHKLNVTLGGWISGDLENNRREMKRLVDIASRSSNVVRLMVGNEAVLRGDLKPAQLAAAIRQVRAAAPFRTQQPEPGSPWITCAARRSSSARSAPAPRSTSSRKCRSRRAATRRSSASRWAASAAGPGA